MVLIEAFNEYSSTLMTSFITSGSTLSTHPTTSERQTTFQKNSIDSKLDSINMLKSIIDRISKLREYPKNANTISKNNNYNNDNDILNSNSNFRAEVNNNNNNNIKIESSTVETFDSLLALAKKSVSISFKDYLIFQQQRQLQQTSSHFSIGESELNNRIKHTTLSTPMSASNLINSSSSLLKSLAYSNLTMELLNGKNQLWNVSLAQVVKISNLTSELSSLKSPVDTDTLKSSWSLLSETPIPNKDSSLLIGIAFFYSILIITSLTSNPLLIYVLLWRRKAQIKLIDIFVANLSLSDLFLTLFNIPLSLILYFAATWPFGSLLCQIGTYSTSCSIYVNIFTMAYISIDRYFAVTRPFISSNQNYHMRKKSILMDDRMRRKIYLVLTLIWIIALILSLPQFLFSKVSSTKIASDRDYINYSNKELKNKADKDLKDLELIKIDLFFQATTTLATKNKITEREMTDTDGDLLLLSDISRNSDPSDATFKHCILEYPYVNMRYFMILSNFLLQYLIPSIVILYFYGRIIYHLYLNLNVEELMEAPLPSSKHIKPITRSRASSESVKNDIKKAQNIDSASFSTTALHEKTQPIQRKHSRMRIEGLNRTRNLKKSIKVMIIIIALFLLSWLPLHTYRLITTFYPLISDIFEEVSNEKSLRTIVFGNLSQNQTEDYIKSFMKKNASPNNFKTLHNKYVFLFFYFMAMSSVCYNPIVYFWMHKKFRLEVKQIFGRIFNFSRWLKKNRESTRSTITHQTTRKNLEITMTNNSEAGQCAPMLPQQASILKFPNNKTNDEIEVFGDQFKANNSQRIHKKKKVSYMASFKIRSKRFSSLSSESNASKKSDL